MTNVIPLDGRPQTASGPRYGACPHWGSSPASRPTSSRRPGRRRCPAPSPSGEPVGRARPCRPAWRCATSGGPYAIDTERRAAMAVAQWAHESDRFRTKPGVRVRRCRPGSYGSWEHPARRRRPVQGPQAHHGPGRSNYAAMGKALGLDLINRPELLAQSPHGEMASGQWWNDNGCNGFCDRDSFVGLTRRINGGLTGLADRQTLYAKARKVAKYLVPLEIDPWRVLTKQERTQIDVLESERRVATAAGTRWTPPTSSVPRRPRCGSGDGARSCLNWPRTRPTAGRSRTDARATT